MKYIKRLSLILLLSALSFGANAQFWYGPKAGINRNDFTYESETYLDSFRVDASYSFEVGAVLIYQANEIFSVQTELFYEREKRKIQGDPELDITSSSDTKNSFLSLPAMFRVSFGKGATHYYLSGGPKLQMWLGGQGTIDSGDGEFFEEDKEWNRLVFNQNKSNISEKVYAVPEAKRFQYALVLGGGVYFDLYFGGRLLLDAKYAFGHSNMGFNNNQDFTFLEYTENFEYRSNTLSISLAYLFEYDMLESRKGMSTIKASNKKKKKK